VVLLLCLRRRRVIVGCAREEERKKAAIDCWRTESNDIAKARVRAKMPPCIVEVNRSGQGEGKPVWFVNDIAASKSHLETGWLFRCSSNAI